MLGFVGLSLLTAFAAGSVAIANMKSWYGALLAPPMAPHMAGFIRLSGLLTVSYLAMGMAAWLVWRRPLAVTRQRIAISAWGWQLALSAAWPAAFFGLHELLAASVLAAGLVACAALTFLRFSALDRFAGVLLLPCFGFAVAALYLTAGFWSLNH